MTTIAPAAPAVRQQPLWNIGVPGSGYTQFSPDFYGHPGSPTPVFRVGESNPATDWPQHQWSPLHGNTGYQPLEAIVLFEAPAPAPAYELVLHVRGSHGPCPHLEVELNGHVGLALVHPVRTERPWHPNPPSPISGQAEVRVALPAGCFVPGENRLVLRTVVLDPMDPDELLRQPMPAFHTWFGTGIAWEALALHTIEELPDVTTALRPLPLYVETPTGLAELIDVEVTTPAGTAGGRVRLEVGEHTIDAQVEAVPFGGTRVRLAVPELDAPATARVTTELAEGTHTTLLPLVPCRKWTLHLIPHVHLDLGYTDVQAKVMELHSRNLDRALGLMNEAPDYSFAIDGALVVDEYRASRSPAAFEKVLDGLRSGALSVNAFWALFLSGIASREELYRYGYSAAALRRDHGVPVDVAHLTDVPTYSWAVPSAAKALGVRGFFGISNHGRGGNADSDVLHHLSPVRWEGPDGASVVAFFADCYAQLRFLCADPPTISGCADAFTRYVEMYDRDDYLLSDLPIVGTHSDNEDLARGEADLVGRWSAAYAWPKLQFSTFNAYLAAVLPYEDQLPIVRGDGGSYWEDGVGAQAIPIAEYRRAQTLLPTAEGLAALLSVHEPTLRPARAALDRAWEGVLIGSEHTWSADHATTQPHTHSTTDQLSWKLSRMHAGHRLALDEARRSMSQLGELMATDGPSLIVHNPLPWTRDVEADLEIHASVDVEGAQIDVVGQVDLLDRARVRVRDVPAFGVLALPMRFRKGGLRPGADEPQPMTEETVTGRWRVRVDPSTGRLAGLTHLGTGQELLDADSPWGLGEILYVSGGGTEEGRGLGIERTSLYDADPYLPSPELTVTRMTQGAHRIRRSATGHLISIEGSGPTLPEVRVDIELRDDSDRVDVVVSLLKEPTFAKESVYVAFPFAVGTDPVVHYDRQQGWVDPAVDVLPGACTEWLAVQDTVCVSGSTGAVTWASTSAPLVAIGDVVRGRWSTSFTPSGTILSWVMNNYWWTNSPASQDGRLTLRYAFTPSMSFDPAAAARFGREVRTPGLVSPMIWHDKVVHTGDGMAAGSLMETDLPAGVDVTVLAPREGAGLLLRVRETAGRDSAAVVRWPGAGPATASLCTAAEDELDALTLVDGAVTVPVVAYGITSVLLRPA
ncbi:MAG: hypothetical protein JJD92_01995 [Frankiaceae bacterium]|nr:hypothetical protein [Frankiaceae bacterium]